MEKVYTELSFERVARYMQCRGIYLVKEMCSKTNGCITFNYLYTGDGDVAHLFIVGFPEGSSKRGKQYIEFCGAYGDANGCYLIKKVKCNNIMDFAREFEEFAYGKFALDSSENFSYLEDEECTLPSSIEEDDNWDKNRNIWLQKTGMDIFELSHRVGITQLEDDVE